MTLDEYRQLGRDSLFDFAHDILGYDKMRRELHGPWCEWAQDMSVLRKVRLAPRGSYKTSLLTVSFAL